MPGPYKYPGVYIEEIPSGVHAISGVSTSITAFVGTTGQGPVNKAKRVTNFSDYLKSYGNLKRDSELGYAVRQFFLNGGNEAWIVRVAGAVASAFVELKTTSSTPVVRVQALNPGNDGNCIEVRVNYDTPLPESTFNLTLHFDPVPEDPGFQVTEFFSNLSMNPNDPNYVEKQINGSSHLVQVQDHKADVTARGVFRTAPIDSAGVLADDRHKCFKVQINDLEPIDVTLDVSTTPVPLATINTLLTNKLRTVADVSVTTDHRLEIKSKTVGANSSVRLLPGTANDLSSRLKIMPNQGAQIQDAAGSIRPAPQPIAGTLTSGDFAVTANMLASNSLFEISLDGQPKIQVNLGNRELSGTSADILAQDLAARIEDAVRKLRPMRAPFSNFTCQAKQAASYTQTDKKFNLVLSSGTMGAGSSVAVSATTSAGEDIATVLQLASGSKQPSPGNLMLDDGNADPITPNSLYSAYISANDRGGIYALEDVDLFNILCLPGVSNTDVINDASLYCEKRRAFLIVDPPQGQTIDEIETPVLSHMPKSRNAALYYPWIEIADPLDGRPRRCPPSGTIAGLYARTDSTRGIWKAPAGIDASLGGVRNIERTLTDEENGILNVLGVNCLRSFTSSGIVAWGARTLRGNNDLTDEYKYIPVRRLALFIEESLYRGLKWVVFEPNDEPLWSQIRLNAGSFMNDLFRQGAFQGKTPREAYLVKCDRETTSESDRNNGIVNILVGFAPLKPAEFVIVKLQQMAGQLTI